ncbi:MAG: PD-(D/E)XK nuclease family protein [Anaerolineae bacterium]|nr:PD-(D/E)XK nuclease family protein [Anaerolineae bacterium]
MSDSPGKNASNHPPAASDVLEKTTHFSQYSLQDFVDCPRRYDLRHRRKLQWPAVQSLPVLEQEERMARGEQFHRLVQQHLSGIPVEKIEARIHDPILLAWWGNFTEYDPLALLPPRRLAEYALSAPFLGYRLLAKYDLLAIAPGETAHIMDWKTAELRPRGEILRAKVQSRLYPFLLALGGERLFGGTAPKPEQIRMTYWFAAFPEAPEEIGYSKTQFNRDRDYLAALIEDIFARSAADDFPPTDNLKRCDYCQYRSYCERGVEAGAIEEVDDESLLEQDPGFTIDFEQIGEIAF